MARRRYGSKAAYEAARGSIRAERERWEREWNMTDEERTKQRNKERLEGDEAMMTFTMPARSIFIATLMSSRFGSTMAT